MSSPANNVILVGPSGEVGKAVLGEFISSALFNLSVLSREASTATFPSSVKVIKTDYSPESVAKAFQGQDAVVSMVGKAGVLEQKLLVDAAVKAGVKRFLPSEYGLNSDNQAVRTKVPLHDEKMVVMDYLRTKEKDGLTWSAVNTGPLFDWCVKRGALGFNLNTKTVSLWDGGDIKFCTTNMATVGKAIVSLLSTSERFVATANKYVYISSHTVSQKQLLPIYEKITDAKWTTEHISSKETLTAAIQKFKGGDPTASVNVVRYGFLSSEELSNFEKIGLANEILGLPKEDLESDLRQLLEDV